MSTSVFMQMSHSVLHVVMERAGNGQPGVGGPPGGGIRVIDSVSSRRDVYTPENPQVTTKGDRRTTEWKCGRDIF